MYERYTLGATTLTVAQMPSHNHTATGIAKASGSGFYTVSNYPYTNGSTTTNNTGGSSSHTHSLSGTASIALNVKYTDVIICSKD